MSTAPTIDRQPRPAEPPLTLVRGEGRSEAPAAVPARTPEERSYAGPLGVVRKLTDRFGVTWVIDVVVPWAG